MSRIIYDHKIKQYFATIYQNMGINLAITALTSYVISNNNYLLHMFFTTKIFYAIFFMPFIINFYLNASIEKLSENTAFFLFFLYGITTGIMISPILLIYKLESIILSFALASLTFIVTSIFGRTTNRDLTEFASISSFIIISILGFSLLGMLFGIKLNQIIISSLIIFSMSIFISFKTQELKSLYYANSNANLTKISILGSLQLYIAFINLLIHILRLFGERKNREE